MEQPREMPPQESLPVFVCKFMAEWLERNERSEIISHIFDQYRLADACGLIRTVMDYSAYFGFDDDDTEGKGKRSFSQGMLFGLGTAYDWMGEELAKAPAMIGEVEKDFTKAGNEIVSDDQEEPNWSEVLLDFGQAGIGLVSGYGKLVEDCVMKITSDEYLYQYFRAGAGLMMRIVLTERNLQRKQEVDDLNSLYSANDAS